MKVVIVGFGSIGKRHLQNFKSVNKDLKVSILRTHSKNKDLDGFNDMVSDVFFSIEEALAWKPNVVVVANPAPFHIETALAFAKAGAHIFMEKPIADLLEGVDELIKECEQRNLVFFVGYCMRFSRSFQIMKEAIDSGKIGRVLFARAASGQYLPKWRPGTEYQNNVTARKELGGGIVLELSHEIDYLRWFCGEISEVNAICGKQSNLSIDVEDVAEINLRFESGAIGNIHLDMVDQARNRSCRIVGEKGTIHWDLTDNSKVKFFSAKNEVWVDLSPDVPYDRNEMFIKEIEHFLNCVSTGTKPLVTAEDGKRVLEIALEAKRDFLNKEVVNA